MLEDNGYFAALARTVREWREREEEREKELAEAVAAHGYSSAQVDDLKASRVSDPCPLSNGTATALGNWRASVEDGRDEFVLADFLWDADVDDFVAALEAAGIDRFVTTDRSTALMGNVHAFAKRGYVFESVCEVETRTAGGKTRLAQGIRFAKGR